MCQSRLIASQIPNPNCHFLSLTNHTEALSLLSSLFLKLKQTAEKITEAEINLNLLIAEFTFTRK